MPPRILTAAFVALALAPGFLTAQERERAFSFIMNRARLGVTVQIRADEETDRYGAKIESVIPDGPAADAGIKEGDIITKFGATNLAGVKADAADESGPGARLVELARDLDAGDTVRVEYRRDGGTHTATIVAEELGPKVAFGRSMMPDLPKMRAMPRFETGPDGGFTFFGINGPHGLDLIEMNPDLAGYFGTTEGLLVVRAPGDSAIPLRAGDVILTIDGRKPSSEAHAMRIIRSYDEGETVKVTIMRKQQRMTVDWKVKEPEMHYRGAPRVRQMVPARERTRM